MEDKKVVVADLSFLNEVQNAPVGRRGGDASSERGKVREFLFKNVLDAMVASQATKNPISEIELTGIITRMRAMAVDKDGKIVVVDFDVNGKLTLPANHKWYFLPNESDSSDRYRGVRNYITGLLKSRKEFALEKKFSAKRGKELTFIVYKGAKAAKVKA